MTAQTQNQTAPAYVQFAAAIRALIQAQGLPPAAEAPTPSGFPENENFFFVEWGPHGQAPALIVPKSKVRMGALHSHLDLSHLAGYLPLSKPNGKVVCQFEPDLSRVAPALQAFADRAASKRPTLVPVRRQVAASGPALPTASRVASRRVGTVDDLTAGLEPAPAHASEDDVEEALQALGLRD